MSKSLPPARRPIRAKRVYTKPAARGRAVSAPSRLHMYVGWALVALAATMTVTHLAEHAGAIQIMARNLEDLLIGFPMAAIVGMAGFVALIWR